MVAVRDELRRGNLWVEGSRRYRQLADFFLPEPEWTARRADFFSRARLPAKAEDGGRFLARRLAAAYDRFQSRFPENAQVKVTEDGWRLSSDVAERRFPEEQQALERLTSWMGAHNPIDPLAMKTANPRADSLRSPRPSDLLACQLASRREDHSQGVYSNVRLDRR